MPLDLITKNSYNEKEVEGVEGYEG